MVIHIQTWDQSPKKYIQIIAEPTSYTNTNLIMCYDIIIVKCKKSEPAWIFPNLHKEYQLHNELWYCQVSI